MSFVNPFLHLYDFVCNLFIDDIDFIVYNPYMEVNNMPLTMGEKIKIVLNRRNMTVTKLADALGTTRQNLTNKFSRDNFSEKEIIEISRVLNCEFIGSLRMLDTDEVI